MTNEPDINAHVKNKCLELIQQTIDNAKAVNQEVDGWNICLNIGALLISNYCIACQEPFTVLKQICAQIETNVGNHIQPTVKNEDII